MTFTPKARSWPMGSRTVEDGLTKKTPSGDTAQEGRSRFGEQTRPKGSVGAHKP